MERAFKTTSCTDPKVLSMNNVTTMFILNAFGSFVAHILREHRTIIGLVEASADLIAR